VNRFWKKEMKMLIKRFKWGFIGIILAVSCLTVKAQEVKGVIDYLNPGEYIIDSISVSGIKHLDTNALIGLSGLRVGQELTVPGDVITTSVKKLWEQGLFSDIRVSIIKTRGDSISLDIYLQERPRLSSLKIEGVKNSESQDIIEKIALPNGSQLTAFILNNTERIIKDHFVEKGFLNTTVEFIQKDDPDRPNNVILTVKVDKQSKIRIGEITFAGNKDFEASKLKRQMKGTKVKNWNFFRSSKFIASKFEEDKEKLKTFYNDNGYKDFAVVSDSVYPFSKGYIGLKLNIEEGKQYFLRKIDWVGNSIYPKQLLDQSLNIEKGTVYNQTLLDKRLNIDENAVSSLYLDNGYLFSKLIPVESKIEGDSVDLEVRIFEGDQAYLNNIMITGNSRTNEHVPRRELYTLPGDLFSKEAIIRSVRQIGVLGHFDPEKINPQPIPDPANGTVDLLYPLEERANDQFEISGGWGAGMLVGTVGVRFNNFSMKHFFSLKDWRPYPSGDGQSLSIRVQSNGKIYQSYNISFVEPWLGGKKPNTFNVSVYRSLMTNGQKKGEDGRQSMIVDGASIGLGKRLEWPDDFFSLYEELSYQRYNLNNYQQYSFLFQNGTSNLLSLTTRITRFSTSPNLIYPRKGSQFSLSLQLTPPYTALNKKDMSDAPDEVKYQWIEFHKWVFKADYYYPLSKNEKLVLNTKFAFGYLGFYNPDIGPSPFENFSLGGDGMTGYSLYGREVIALRGYSNGSLTPKDATSGAASGNLYTKLTFEIRYPISLNPQATIFGLAFLESGKAWQKLSEFNPFGMYRAAGVGVRANLPMFGLLGIDWGYGFTPVPGQPSASGSQFHFVIGQQF
jgi:outer membrane protein insertion porin family